MRSWLTHDFGGVPRWLLLLAPVLVVVLLVVAFAPSVTSRPETAGALPVYTPKAYPSSSRYTLPKDPRLVIFGDSYTQGFAASPLTKGYAYLVAKDLGWRTQIEGVGGTGYTYGGGGATNQDFGTRIKAYIAANSTAPDVVVIEGSQNDYRSVNKITSTVVADVDLLKKAYPKADIVLFGPAAPQPLQNQLSAIDAADAAAAAQLNVPYISPYQEGWITTANTKQYGYSDGAHLNTAGHAYLAQRFLADFKPLFGMN